MPKVVYNNCFGGFGLSEEAINWLKNKGLILEDDYAYISIPRHHPLLVECVETLGHVANDQFSDLQIKEVENFYRIEEYDGAETVLEPKDIQYISAII